MGEVIQGGLDPGEDPWAARAGSATLCVIESFRGVSRDVREVKVELRYIRGMCAPGAYRRGDRTLVMLSRLEGGGLVEFPCGGSRFSAQVPEELRAVRDYFGTRREELRRECRQ